MKPVRQIKQDRERTSDASDRSDLSDTPYAVARLSSPARDMAPLLRVQWWRVLFLHFAVEPAVVRRELPAAFELELHQGRAIVSIVALTKRRFCASPNTPLWARLFSLLREQRFLNLRTYVRDRGEPGAFFFWSWLSRPLGLPLPDRPLGLTCAFARADYRHDQAAGTLQGRVSANGRAFAYGAQLPPPADFVRCPAGSLSEFALERYTGYYWHRGGGRVFRAAHPPWLQTRAVAQIHERSLVEERFPWFRDAQFIEANYTPGFDGVLLGRACRLHQAHSRSRHGPSALLEMP